MKCRECGIDPQEKKTFRELVGALLNRIIRLKDDVTEDMDKDYYQLGVDEVINGLEKLKHLADRDERNRN